MNILTVDTPQEAYDTIVAWFSRPNAQLAKLPGGDCWYRLNGDPESQVRCAVGCLIKDEHYKVYLEGNGVSWFAIADPALEWFLKEAQILHDGSKTVGNFLEHLKIKAGKFGLKI